MNRPKMIFKFRTRHNKDWGAYYPNSNRIDIYLCNFKKKKKFPLHYSMDRLEKWLERWVGMFSETVSHEYIHFLLNDYFVKRENYEERICKLLSKDKLSGMKMRCRI